MSKTTQPGYSWILLEMLVAATSGAAQDLRGDRVDFHPLSATL